MKEAKSTNLTHYKERLIGLEFENPIIDENGEPIEFPLIQEIWKDFEKRGWILEKDPVYGVSSGVTKLFPQGIVNLSVDFGASNFETALPPVQNIEEAMSLYTLVRDEILKVLSRHHLSLAASGIYPGTIDDTSKMRDETFLMTSHEIMGGSNQFNTGVVSAISAHQVNVSVKIDEMVAAVNGLTKIAGFVVALCGNSAIHAWNILPWKEWRILAWDFRFRSNILGFEKLSGYHAKPFDSLSELFNYYWAVPFMPLSPRRDNGSVIPEKKVDYKTYFKSDELEGKDLLGNKTTLKPAPRDLNLAMIAMWPFTKAHIVLDVEKVTVDDFMEHLEKNNLESYLVGKLTNCYVEFRAGAAAPKGEESALPAFILGLVNNLEKFKEFTEKFTWEEGRDSIYRAAVSGLEAKIGDKKIIDLLPELVSIAEEGLKRRSFNESTYLQPLLRRLKEKKNPADEAILKYKEGRKEFLSYISYKI